MPSIRVVHVGLGPIGCAIVRQVVSRAGLAVVGAVDVDPTKIGRDLGDIAGLNARLGVRVEGESSRVLRSAKPHIVIHCTSSSIVSVMPQIETILKSGTPIVSTTEELSYPRYAHVREARRIDAWAKKARVAVLATGVNPGFAMDTLPIALTAVCERVDRVVVTRIQDAGQRRLPFQQKIGIGLTAQEFRRKVNEGSVRHVGLTESIAMIADALGWRLERTTDEVRPRLAEVRVASEFLSAGPGFVCGILQDGIGYRDGQPSIHLRLEAYLGATDAYDAVEITGLPSLAMKVTTGIQGDIATASIIINSIPKVLAASPGLHTMRDLALPSFFPGPPTRRG